MLSILQNQNAQLQNKTWFLKIEKDRLILDSSRERTLEVTKT